jgi:hypothetical protein
LLLKIGRGDWMRAKRGASRATPEDVAATDVERQLSFLRHR